jgi:hypothetical protein
MIDSSANVCLLLRCRSCNCYASLRVKTRDNVDHSIVSIGDRVGAARVVMCNRESSIKKAAVACVSRVFKLWSRLFLYCSSYTLYPTPYSLHSTPSTLGSH